MNGDQMDQKKTLAYLDEAVVDPIWNPMMKMAAVDCLSKTSIKLKELQKLYLDLPNNNHPEECHVGILAFVECHMAEIYANCPVSTWIDSTNCNAVKEAVVKCNSNIENVISLYVSKIAHNH